jgi:hypothetical protein
MSVRDTRSATVGGLQTADLLAALGQIGLDRGELCRAGLADRLIAEHHRSAARIFQGFSPPPHHGRQTDDDEGV